MLLKIQKTPSTNPVKRYFEKRFPFYTKFIRFNDSPVIFEIGQPFITGCIFEQRFGYWKGSIHT